MSSEQATLSAQAQQMNRNLAEQYYGAAMPALKQRFGAINQSLQQGEPSYMTQAFGAQRTGLTEGALDRQRSMLGQQAMGSKQAGLGGNPYAAMHPADIGSQLANALYGSRFQQGQANIDQSMNLMSMALGGAGTTGSGALQAAGTNLQAIGYTPNYNPTYASILGGANLLGAGYGAYQQANAGSPAQINLTSFAAE